MSTLQRYIQRAILRRKPAYLPRKAGPGGKGAEMPVRLLQIETPVLVDGVNGIIAGHGRVLAARKLGLASVPVIELGHLSESQKRAYILADNRLAEAAGWDR